MAKKKPLFKIDPGSEVKGTGRGDILVTCTPDHPFGETRSEHDKRYIYKHIAVMERHLGRYLSKAKGEEVHHKNGDPSDNRLSNLELTVKGLHQRDHALTDNPFWKKSPENKPQKKYKPHRKSKKAMAQNVASAYLKIN
jgi:hypothetical protein